MADDSSAVRPEEAPPAPRLNFAQLKHCGRQEELKRLKDIFHACCKAVMPMASSVIVEAASGLGKTALVDTFVEQVHEGALLVGRGKFEEATAASEPFSAIVGATECLLEQLSRSEERQLWIQLISEALGADTSFMCGIIPGLGRLIYGDDQLNDSPAATESFTLDGFGDMTDKEWRFERFRLGLRTLLRCLSTRKPVLFVLDDMQWAEQDSITVIWTIMEDTFPKRRLMILGASRPIPANEHLHMMIQQIGTRLLSTLTLTALRVQDVANILANLFDCRPAEVDSLAAEVLCKCSGNTFVLLQFLRISEQRGHIFYSNDEQKWRWDEAAIIDEASIAERVIDVVANDLLSVDPERKAALITAACFGTSHFEVDTIVHAMKLISHDGETLSSEMLDDEAADYDEVDPFVVRRNIRKMKETLRRAARDGLVFEISEGHYRFTHDRIREAAYSLIPTGISRTKLHLKIGRQLRSWMETQSELIGISISEESLLLNATNQLNLGASLIEDDWERLDLAELNYQAAEHSARKSSFVPAMDFLVRGLLQLGDERWETHYHLTLKLTVALTRIQFCCGMYDACLESAQQVIDNSQSFAEKRPVYHTCLLALLQEERQKDATDTALSILNDLGVKFPRKCVLLKGYVQHIAVDKTLRALSKEELMNLPIADDPDGRIEDMVGFINRLAEISFHGGEQGYVVHCTNKAIQLTLEHGRNSRTAFSFFAWAWVKSMAGQLDEARRIAEVAIYYAAERRWPTHDLRTELMYNAFFRMFKATWSDLVDPIHDMLGELRREGAMEIVLMDNYLFLRQGFVSGMPLTHLIECCAESNEMLLDYRQPLFWSFNASITQAILNLLGHSSRPCILTGEHMDRLRHVEAWMKSGNKKALGQYFFFQMVLSVLFRDYDLALESVTRMPPLMHDGFGVFVPLRLFYTGIALLGASRKKWLKRSSRRREAYKIIQKLNGWVSTGLKSCKHMEMILRAKVYATSKVVSQLEVQNAFHDAIEEAKSSGVIQNEALANELAGSWMAEQTGKEEKYSPFLVKAATLYEAWGAAVKVDDIMRRFPQCFGDQPALKSEGTLPMTGSVSSSMWSTSLYTRSLKEAPKLRVESDKA